MALKFRIIFFFLFAISVIFTGGVLLFYFTGHRYDFGKNRIVTTGSLRVFMAAENADIFMNDKKIGRKKDVLINNLGPGVYELKIKKENHQEWRKKISVYESKTTLVGPILLFPTKPEEEILFSNIDHYTEHNGFFAMIYTNATGVNPQNMSLWDTDKQKITSMANGETEKISDISLPYPGIAILKTTDKDQHTEHAVYEKQERKFILEKIIGENIIIQKIRAMNNSEIYILANDVLWTVDIKNQTANKTTENIMDIEMYKNILWCLEKNQGGEADTILKRCKKTNGEETILTGSQWNFLEQNTGNPLIKNVNDGEIISFDGKTQKSIAENMLSARYNQDANSIVLWNDFEIWLYTRETEELKLIMRQSKKIQNVRWLDKNDYVIFSDEQGLHAIELDSREKNQTFTLVAGAWPDWNVTGDGKKIAGIKNDGDTKFITITLAE